MKDIRKLVKAMLVVSLLALAVCALLVWRINASMRQQPPATGEVVRQSPAVQPVDLRILVGRWVRTDTPYVIEIKAANEDGTLQAAYYNPRSINVSRAEARDKNGKTQVFLELRDVNYPGSNYTLTYDRARDLLHGVYFQAVMKENFDVAFRRLQTM
jgi:hypothetical protein